MDFGLEWATYVVGELEARQLSLERLRELIDDLKEHKGTADDFISANPEIGAAALSWLANLQTLLAILTLLYAIYLGQRTLNVADQQLDVAEHQLDLARRQSAPRALTADEIRRLAAELHRLQQAVQISHQYAA
jgi:hypothetical protein